MNKQEVFKSRSPEETVAFGRSFAEKLSSGDVVALSGELGAGKTWFAKGLCCGLGYEGEVTSPSFVYVHSYQGRVTIHHADFYLVRSQIDVFSLGLDELYGNDCIVMVEWAQRYPNLFPDNRWWIEIEWQKQDLNSRLITVSKGKNNYR